ncbi:MAG: DUF502 domain-containing protein [Myxococcota bacterium]
MTPTLRERFRRNFVTGFVVTIPLVASLLVVGWLISALDSILPDLLRPTVWGSPLPGLGIVVFVVIVLVVGTLTRNLVGQRLLELGGRIVRRVPVLGATYEVFRQATQAVVKPGGGGYQRAVLVEFPRKGVYAIAFVTQAHAPPRARAKLGEDLVSVFVPTTPNPTSGFYVMMRRDEVIEVDFSPQEALRLILSAGMVSDRAPTPAPLVAKADS